MFKILDPPPVGWVMGPRGPRPPDSAQIFLLQRPVCGFPSRHRTAKHRRAPLPIRAHGKATVQLSVCTGRVAVAAKVGSPSAPTRRARAAGLRAASLPVWWWRVRMRISLSGGLVGLSTTRFAEQPRRLCHSRAARTHGTVAASLSQRGSLGRAAGGEGPGFRFQRAKISK